MTDTWSTDRLGRLQDVLDGHVARGDVPGLAWLVARHGEVHAGVAGTFDPDGQGAPVARDTIFRISSMSKPVAAVAALLLVEECRLRLDEPVDELLPELADRRVLVDPTGPLDDTVPAERPITVRDLLTFRLGLGMDFAGFHLPQPVLEAMGDLELGAGPPNPAGLPAPDEWMRRLGTLPLSRQPGERWLYNTGASVVSVLVARAAGQPFETFLRERIFEPLGMRDTGFAVPAADWSRFGACHGVDPASGDRFVYDPSDGQWTTPPAFPNGADGLVSTVDDYAAFASLLLAGGAHPGGRLLARPTVELLRTDQLTEQQRLEAGPSPDSSVGWGLGLGVRRVRTGVHNVGSYGWDGGLGSMWTNDPAEDLTGIILTNQAWASPTPPPVCEDFWTATYAAIGD